MKQSAAARRDFLSWSLLREILDPDDRHPQDAWNEFFTKDA
jgi:hypothetical protein